MVRLEFLRKLKEQGDLKEGLVLGVIGTQWNTYLDMYETYYELIKTKTSKDARADCCNKYNISRETFYLVLRKLNANY